MVHIVGLPDRGKVGSYWGVGQTIAQKECWGRVWDWGTRGRRRLDSIEGNGQGERERRR